MKFFLSSLFLLIVTKSTAQTHFTIPQNVWRFTVNYDLSSGKWKSNSFSNKGMHHIYKIDTTTYSIYQNFKRKTLTNKLNIEYGFTDRTTLVFQIPYIQKITENRSWFVENESSSFALDSLFSLYYPKPISNNGLSDLTIGVNVLLKGAPAWRGGKQKFSLYSGIDMIFPFAETLKKYDPFKNGSGEIPYQFRQIPLGEGLTEIRLRFFGEFYRKGWGRLFNINWKIGLSGFQKAEVNPRITFLWIEDASADSIANTIGDVIQKKSIKINTMVKAQVELFPKKIFFTTGVDWEHSGRDKFYSSNPSWDGWMSKRKGYDSKNMLTYQFVKVNLFNLDPYLMIGPFPFELEVGARWFLPYPLTFNGYGGVSSWVQLSTYFQAW